MLEHNPNLDRWGNAMEFINGVAAGAVNPFLSAGEAVGVGDAVQGVGFGIDLATMAAISPMSAEAAMNTVGGLGGLGRFENQASTAVRSWTAANPNAAETVEAAFNVAAVTKAAKLAKTGAGKAAVSDNFADAHRAGRSQTAAVANSQVGIEWGKGIGKQGMPWENYVGRNLPADARLPKNFKTFDYFDINSGKAVSAKTLDTQTASRIANPKQVYNTMKRQVDAAVRFDQHTLSGIELNSTMIKQREIQIAVPAQTNAAQKAEIQRAVEYGKSRNVNVIVTEIK